jgi:putative transposase
MLRTRSAFIHRVRVLGEAIAKACREYGISRKTGYKWLDRFDAEPGRSLEDRSRRPHSSPQATPVEVEQRILEARDATGFGPRRLAEVLA